MKELPRVLGMRQLVHDQFDEPEEVKGQVLITSCRIEETPSHDIVHVWNRGAKSGELVVNKGDGYAVCVRLFSSEL